MSLPVRLPSRSEVPVSSTKISEGQQRTMDSINDEKGPPVQEKKKKRKKQVGTKEERRLKREAEKLKQIYAPKDSHVQMITPEVLQKLKGEYNTRSQSGTTNLFPKLESQKNFYPSTSFNSQSSSGTSNNAKLFESSLDFPSLGASVIPSRTARKTDRKVEPILPKKINAIKSNDCESGWETDAIIEDEGRDFKNRCEETSHQLETERLPELAVPCKGKLSKKPLIISINELIESKKDIRSPIKTIEKKKKRNNEKVTVGNLLDSSGPVVMNRGKIREKPKPKRNTPLKRAILRTRSLRQANIATKFPKCVNANADVTNTSPISEHLEQDLLPTDSLDKLVVCKEEPIEQPKNNEECYNTLLLCDNMDFSFKETKHLVDPNDIPFETKPIVDGKLEEDSDIFGDRIREIIKYAEESAQSSQIEFSKDVHLKAKAEMHSKKFRPYCDMYTSKDLHGKVWELLKELHRFQDRLYHSDPIKYKLKKRYIHGLKDVYANLKLNKLVFIVISPDIESNSEKGGLDEMLENIKALALEKGVPYIFSGNRYILGKPIRIKTPVSAIGILDYQAAEELYKKIMEEACKLREEYEADFAELLQKLTL